MNTYDLFRDTWYRRLPYVVQVEAENGSTDLLDRLEEMCREEFEKVNEAVVS